MNPPASLFRRDEKYHNEKSKGEILLFCIIFEEYRMRLVKAQPSLALISAFAIFEE